MRPLPGPLPWNGRGKRNISPLLYFLCALCVASNPVSSILLVTRHSSLVTRHSSLVTRHLFRLTTLCPNVESAIRCVFVDRAEFFL